MANILGSPNDISKSPWGFGGAGASVTSATTVQTASSGSASLDQTMAVVPGTTYTCTVTLQGTVAAGDIFCAVYPTDYSTTYGAQDITLTTSAQVASYSAVIPAGVTSAIFELDFNSNSASVVTITNLSMSPPSTGLAGSLSLLGVGT